MPVDLVNHTQILNYFLHGWAKNYWWKSKNLRTMWFGRLLFLFKLKQFTLCGFSAASDLPLRQ
jgi:hypothetical protein